jgi:hypothetical protein
MNKLVIVRLDTGDDIVGYLAEEDEKELVLDEALAIKHVYEADSNYPSVYLVKYMVYNDSYSVKLNQNRIVSVFEDPIEALQNYHKKTIQKIRKLRDQDSGKIDEEMMTAILQRITSKTLQ